MNTIKNSAGHQGKVFGARRAHRVLAAGLGATISLAMSAGGTAATPSALPGNSLYRFNQTTAVVVWSGLRRHVTTLEQISAQLGRPLNEANYDRLGRPTQFTFQFPLEGGDGAGSPASSAAGRVAHAVMHDVKRRLIHRGISAIFAHFGGAVGGIASDAAAHMENSEAAESLPTPSEQQGQPPFTARRYPGYHWTCVFTVAYRHGNPVWNGVQPACSPMP